MIGLIFSEIVLFLVAGLLGFAAGWRLSAHAAGVRQRAVEEDIDALRLAVSEAQVRRARGAA
ncbi:MAG: hypothetical protein ABW199_02560 [Caulobacterales bacterium]